MKAIKKSKLTHEIVSDRAALVEAIGVVLRQDPKVRRLVRKVLRGQDRLQRASNPKAWQEFLRLDETTTRRTVEELIATAMWAFSEGRRFSAVAGRKPAG